MSYLYVSDQGSVIGINAHRVEVKSKDGSIRSIPVETLEVIQVFGNVQLTIQCITTCLMKGITVIFYSTKGRFYGRLISPSHVNVERQRKQVVLGNDATFCLEFSKRIVNAKIRNQEVILRRYARNHDIDIESAVLSMHNARKHIPMCENISQLMGYEGIAARDYFKTLGRLIEPAFFFERKSRRPPKDAFNSLISLGYSILMNEIYGKLEAKGLNPYFGVLHSDKEKHPTLASDFMEEWRAVLSDATAMSLINGHEIHKEDFYQPDGDEGIYLTTDGFKSFIRKFEGKLQTSSRYLPYVDYSVNFRRAMDL